MNYTIYHAKKPNFGFGKQPEFPKEYDKIAIVESDELADTFRITNHIDSDWRMNPEVIESFKDKVRSTSVGDVVGDEDGDFFYCASVGWKKLEQDSNKT